MIDEIMKGLYRIMGLHHEFSCRLYGQSGQVDRVSISL